MHYYRMVAEGVVMKDRFDAKAHEKVIARLKRMTPKQLAQTLVDAGIVTKSGKLTKPYREMTGPSRGPRVKPAG